jgi:hypothetical protein
MSNYLATRDIFIPLSYPSYIEREKFNKKSCEESLERNTERHDTLIELAKRIGI